MKNAEAELWPVAIVGLLRTGYNTVMGTQGLLEALVAWQTANGKRDAGQSWSTMLDLELWGQSYLLLAIPCVSAQSGVGRQSFAV
jgi:hypothetical protein